MTVVPCVKNLIEPIKRVLQQLGVGAAMKRVCVMSHIFCETINKVQHKKSGALFIKYLVTAIGSTSVKQAEA